MVWMFSGQGNQYFHMGLSLFNHNQIFRETIILGDTILQEEKGWSVIQVLYDHSKQKTDPFNEKKWTYPIVVLIEVAIAKMLLSEGYRPHYILSVHHGEISSSIITNVINLKTGLLIACEQASTYDYYCENKHIMKLISPCDIKTEQKELIEFKESQPFINDQSLTQLLKTLIELYNLFKSQEIICQLVPLHYVIHSTSHNKTTIQDERETIHLNYVESSPSVNHYQEMIINKIKNHLKVPMKITEAITYIESIGHWNYVDCSPTGKLAHMIKYNLNTISKSEYFPLLTVHGNELNNLETLKTHMIKTKNN